MAIYDVKRLSTTAHCDAALEKTFMVTETLKCKKYKLQHRLQVHRCVVLKTQHELSVRKMELKALSAGLSKLPAGERLAREYHCKITLLQGRIQRLELRLEDYSAQALLIKELQLRRVEAALEDREVMMAQLKAHRAELQQAAEDLRPVSTTQQAPFIPLVPLSSPPPNGKHPAKLQAIDRLRQKRRGKRWTTTTRPSMAVYKAG